jgi:predicted nucleic acid-binding protein
MIYLDSSVALAQLFGETRVPPKSLWDESLISSRLLEYEVWTRAHARGLGATHGEEVRGLLARVALLELSPVVLVRATERFPVAVRTLDAVHLASMDYLRSRGESLTVASYDDRLSTAARKLGFALCDAG